MEIDNENNRKPITSEDRKKCYREHLDKIEELQDSEDVGINTIETIGQIFKEVNLIDSEIELLDRVKYTDEIVLEAGILASGSTVFNNCVQSLEICSSTYDPNELGSKIVNEIRDEETKTIDWLKLLPDARQLVPELPNCSSLYGSFDITKVPEPKQKQERVKRQAQAIAEKKVPQNVHNLANADEDVDDTVNFLFQVLKVEYEKNNFQPIEYFDFTIDSNDFGVTVENMFYTSFLLRDGKVALDIDDENVATLTPKRKRDLKKFRNNGGVNQQIITSITMEAWERLRKNKGLVQMHRELLQSKK